MILEFIGGPWDGATHTIASTTVDPGGVTYVPTKTVAKDGHQLFAFYVHDSDNGIDIVRMKHAGFISAARFSPDMKRAARGE